MFITFLNWWATAARPRFEGSAGMDFILTLTPESGAVMVTAPTQPASGHPIASEHCASGAGRELRPDELAWLYGKDH